MRRFLKHQVLEGVQCGLLVIIVAALGFPPSILCLISRRCAASQEHLYLPQGLSLLALDFALMGAAWVSDYCIQVSDAWYRCKSIHLGKKVIE